MKNLKFVFGFISAMMISGITMGDDDHQESRRLMEQGDILPLQRILDDLYLVHKEAGRVLDIELETEGDDYIYEIEMLDAEGKVWEYKVDAATGVILDKEQED